MADLMKLTKAQLVELLGEQTKPEPDEPSPEVKALMDALGVDREKAEKVLAITGGGDTGASKQTEKVASTFNPPAAIRTEPTPSGQGFELGAAIACPTDKDGNRKPGKPRVYVVPTKDGSHASSDKNQFGMLRATSIHPAVVRLIAANPERAVRIAESVEQAS